MVHIYVYIDVNLKIDIYMNIHVCKHLFVYMHALCLLLVFRWGLGARPRKRNCPKVVKRLGAETG